MFAQNSARREAPATIVSRIAPPENGVLAYDAVAKAPPDGYLDADGQSRRLAMNPHLAKSLPYEPLKSLRNHSSRDGAEHSGGAPFRAGNSLKELIAYAKPIPES